MIELTEEQREAVAATGENPPRVVDPNTQTKYVLVREEVYDRVKRILEADEDTEYVREMGQQTLRLFGREGWDDPAMDIYNDLDPRIQQ